MFQPLNIFVDIKMVLFVSNSHFTFIDVLLRNCNKKYNPYYKKMTTGECSLPFDISRQIGDKTSTKNLTYGK